MLTKEGELKNWTIAIMGGNENPFTLLPGLKMVKRTEDKDVNSRGEYHIGRLLSPRDESVDLTESEWMHALDLTKTAWKKNPGRKEHEPDEPNGPAIRYARGTTGVGGIGRRHGLLLIYPIDPTKTDNEKLKQTSTPIIGIGVSFPTSQLGKKIPYSVNNVAWELEYGSAE